MSNQRVSLSGFVAAAVVVIAAVPASAATAPIVDLGTLPGYSDSRPTAINRHGTVTGVAYTAGTDLSRAVRWDHGRITGLPGQRSTSTGVNNHGTVIGTADVDGRTHAVRWDPVGRIRDLGTLPGHSWSWVSAINDDGVIVGVSATTPGISGVYRAVRWDRAGRITDLGTLPGHLNSWANDVNEDSTIVGFATVASGDLVDYRAVHWTAQAASPISGSCPVESTAMRS